MKLYLAPMEGITTYIYRTAYEYRTFARAIAMSFMMTLIVGSFTLLVNKVTKMVEDKI